MNSRYRDIIRIRTFEEKILKLFGQNKLSGTTHTCIGQEATAVAIMKYVNDNDTVFSNHRCHGHYIAYGGPEELLLAEIMSKAVGVCQGKGGSQHIHYRNFFTNGIQGGIIPNALGVAFAYKYTRKKNNTIVFLGDGTLGQGVVYEALNIASKFEIPIVFVVEDNQYAMSTRRTDVISGNIKTRIEGFDIKTLEIESTDIDVLDTFFGRVFEYINSERKPICAIVHNYRLGAHSKGDDTRDIKEIEMYSKNDPIRIVQEKVGEEEYEKAYQDIRYNLDRIVDKLETEPSIEIEPYRYSDVDDLTSIASCSDRRYVEIIRDALRDSIENNKKIVILGEDIRDPYGGAFKVTKGLSSEYNEQVINMPISEACLVGMSVGMALNGLLPVVEMMFGDFISLGFDQLLNHASKYTWVYGNDIALPLIIRTPMGAGRGYGPTHSQSLEKFLIGIPGIKIIALSLAVDPQCLYKKIFNTIKEPTIIIENKKMYGQKSLAIRNNHYNEFFVKEINNYGYSSFLFSIDFTDAPDCYVITYGGMDESALSASLDLMLKEEIQVDVIILTQLSPIPIKDIAEVIYTDAPVITVEEGTKSSGVGTAIAAECVEYGIHNRFGRVATPDMPIPNGLVLENQVIPNKETIIRRIKEMIG